MKPYLQKILDRFEQKRKNAFGIPDRWRVILFSTLFFCFLSVLAGYYVWYKGVNSDGVDPLAPVPVRSVPITLDQKKLKAMLADLLEREESIRTGEVPTKSVIDPAN